MSWKRVADSSFQTFRIGSSNSYEVYGDFSVMTLFRVDHSLSLNPLPVVKLI